MARFHTLLLLAGPLLGAQIGAQTPRDILAEHRDGQTFVTWRELSTPGTSYRVYRSSSRIRSAGDLQQADFLGEVDDRSSRNQGRSLASGNEQTWVISDGDAPLAASDGLFVYTTESTTQWAFYAVTSVRSGIEDQSIDVGKNATRLAMGETPAPPQPVLQKTSTGLELFGHWVGNRDTPFQPALSLWPSRGYDFVFQPGSAPGPHGLMLSLHAAGQTYAQGWPARFELPSDVDLLLLHDLVPYTSWTFWFGSHEDLPGFPGGNTRVANHTQQRIMWTLDWVAARQGALHDPERVYVAGGSMGAIGGMYLIGEYPERFAAGLLRNGLYDLEASDYRNPDIFMRLFGDFSLELTTRDGIPILDRTNASFMAELHPDEDWPVLRTLGGRNDETVGWSSLVDLMAGLGRAGRPAVHYFDLREHNPNGYWRNLERALVSRTCKVRRDRPSLRFDECSLDDDPGDGSRADGTPIGTVNAYLEYDPETASRSAQELSFDVYLRSKGVLDDAPAERGWARFRPCRTGAFSPAPGDPVLYTLRADGVVVDEHMLFADEHGRVQTPLAPLEVSRRSCRFQRGPSVVLDGLFLGEAPQPGGGVQVVVNGAPGVPWALVLTLAHSGPMDGRLVLSGSLDAAGRSDFCVPLPLGVRPGARVLGRARIDGTWSALDEVTVQGSWTSAGRLARLR